MPKRATVGNMEGKRLEGCPRKRWEGPVAADEGVNGQGSFQGCSMGGGEKAIGKVVTGDDDVTARGDFE